MSARDYAAVGAIGVGLGAALSRIGFSSWDEVHAMFTFADLRLMFVFLFALVLLIGGWTVVRRLSSPRWADRPFHKGSVPGGILFGVGWALTGACPSIALVALGEGQLGALATLAGIFAGNWAYGLAQRHVLKWGNVSCAED